MLITTSRKPSPRTRSFARSLERVSGSKYINRGKMSMRDVLIKSRASGHQKTAVISEVKGNPSRIEFYGSEGELLLSMDITTSNSMGPSKIKKKKLKLRWELERQDLKEKIISLLEIPEDPLDLLKTGSNTPTLKQYADTNLVLVKGKLDKAVVEFHDEEGEITGPRIFIHKCKFGD